MTNRPERTTVNKPGSKRPRRVAPQAHIVPGGAPPERPVFANVFAELKSLGQRTGSALSVVYAQVAGSVLERIEQLEDVNAERKYVQRAKKVEPAENVASLRARAQAPRAENLLSASKTSTLPAKRA